MYFRRAYARALSALTTSELAPSSRATEVALHAKHTEAREGVLGELLTTGTVLEVTVADVHASLLRAPRGSAVGSLGWLFEHLRQAVLDDEGLRGDLTWLVERLVRGEVPEGVQWLFTASRLIPL